MKADVTDAVNLRGKRAVVAMDFRRARVYATDSPGHSRPEGLEAKDPWHLNHNLYHREDNPDGTYDIDAIDTDDYFKTLAVELRVADEVLLLGHGKGKSNASVQFGSYLDKHYSDVLAKVVAIVRCDVEDITDEQLLRLGEMYFGVDVPERGFGDGPHPAGAGPSS